MRFFSTFALGLLARAVSILAAYYCEWLMHKLSHGSDAGFDFLRDLWQFCRRLMAVLAEQICGRPAQRFARYEEEEYEPELFGAR